MNLFDKYPLLWSVIIATIFGVGYFYGVRSEPMLVLGLYMLFNFKEAKQDERVKSILYSSGYFALLSGILLVMGLPVLNIFRIISFKEISLNCFLIVVLAFANVIRFTRQYLLV